MYKSYHAKFPDIPTLTSAEYLQTISSPASSNNYILVDVRSKTEHNVSMIPNSISLQEFETQMKNTSNSVNPDQTVVTYCTIGYRSGLEARRIRDIYHMKVLNLDGIVNYTHACSAMKREGNGGEGPFLQEPRSRKSTKRVHVFGPAWNVVSDDFEPGFFSAFDMALQGMGVGLRVCMGGIKRGLRMLCGPCCRRFRV